MANKQAGRPSKYNEERKDTIYKELCTHGDRRRAMAAAKIHEDTFYDWMKNKPGFSEIVREAEGIYRATVSESYYKQATSAFEDYLFGRVEERWTSEESGNSAKQGEFSKVADRVVNRGVPQWAIERILGKPIDLLEGIKVLVQENVLPPSIISKIANEIDQSKSNIKSIIAESLTGN